MPLDHGYIPLSHGSMSLDQVSMTIHDGSLILDYRSMTLDHGSMTFVYRFMSFIQHSSCEAVNTQLCFFNQVAIQLYSGEKCSWSPRLNTLRAKEKPTWKTDLSHVNNFPSHNGVDDCPRRRFWSWNSQLSWLPNVERSKTSLSFFQNIHTTSLNSNESPRARAQDNSTSSTVTYLWSIRCSGVTLFQVVLYPISET